MRPRTPIAVAMLVVVTTLPAPASARGQSGMWPDARECSNIRPSVQRKCISRRIEAKQRTLARLYPQALAAVRAGFSRWGASDNRLDPRHFVRAHRDWQQFVASNCTAVGAVGGGSNSSVSDRIAECREREIDGRSQLYRQIAKGTYGQ